MLLEVMVQGVSALSRTTRRNSDILNARSKLKPAQTLQRLYAFPKTQQRRDIEVPAVPSPDKSWSYGLNEGSRSPMHRPIEFGNHPQGHCHRIVIVNEAIHFLDPSSPRDRWTRRQVPLQSSQCFISAL